MQDRGWEPDVQIVGGPRPYINFVIEAPAPSRIGKMTIAVCSLEGKELKRFAENILKTLKYK